MRAQTAAMAIAALPEAICCNSGPEGRDPGPENEFPAADAMSSHPYLKTARYGVRHVQHSERSQTPSRGVASGFLNVTRFESDLGAVDFTIDLVVAVDEPDVLSLGAAFERAGAAA
jgi:hypothetical protein